MVPDILTIGKPMGNGFPVSGLVITPTVNDLHAKKAPPHYNSVSVVYVYNTIGFSPEPRPTCATLICGSGNNKTFRLTL